ncbi:hypothetical protein RUM43_000965 [Polyplax serrata]|uniref:C2H2-type domain-containing protein n=1 Tax=Polyplax serrata TaxID=468196 RepID=A0AAN8XT35_POLSC
MIRNENLATDPTGASLGCAQGNGGNGEDFWGVEPAKSSVVVTPQGKAEDCKGGRQRQIDEEDRYGHAEVKRNHAKGRHTCRGWNSLLGHLQISPPPLSSCPSSSPGGPSFVDLTLEKTRTGLLCVGLSEKLDFLSLMNSPERRETKAFILEDSERKKRFILGGVKKGQPEIVRVGNLRRCGDVLFSPVTSFDAFYRTSQPHFAVDSPYYVMNIDIMSNNSKRFIDKTVTVRHKEKDESGEKRTAELDSSIARGYPQVIEFRCTWPGCCYSVCDLPSIEYHVRQTHLGPKKETDLDDLSDHEEEFYYTEVEVSRADVMTNVTMTPPVHPHKDMCRPSHEDPDYQKTRGYPIVRSSSNTPTANTPWSSFTKQMKLGNSYTGVQPDVSNRSNKTFSFGSSEMSWQQTSLSASAPNKINVSKTPGSPTRKARGETKKCRKVYGMEHRELWCTQCKWKKACSRFGD